LRATEDFYPGEQRISVFAQKEVRVPLLCLAAYFPVATVLFLKFGAEYGEAFDVANMLFAFTPVVISVTGGVSGKAWAAYAGFAALAFAGMASYAFTSLPACLLLLVPAFVFFLLFNASAPRVLRNFGITGKLSLRRELPVAAVIALVLPVMIYRVTVVTDFLVMKYMTVWEYVYYAFTCVLLYVPILGYTCGIVTGRLLALNFQLMVPILINTIAFVFFYVPTALAVEPSLPLISGLVICTLGVQMILGLGYYYSRSTRFLFTGYLIFYLIYKSVGT